MSLQTMDFSVTEKSGHGRITYTYIIRVTENKVDVIKNTSHVTVEAILKQSYSGTAFSGYRTGVSCTVNAETLFSDYCRRTISGKKEHVFYTWQGELPHAPDGTLVLQVEGKLWQTKKADYTPPTMAPQGEMALTPIARASRVGAADGVIGSRTTVVITPWVPEAAHTIHYQFGEEQGYIAADGSISPEPVVLTGQTVSFLLPESFYHQIPDSTWGTCTLTCATYVQQQLIGQQQTQLRVSTDYRRCFPVASWKVEDINPNTLALTGDPERIIRYMSCLRVTLQARGVNGAQIRRRSVNGVELTDDYLDIDQVHTDQVQAAAEDTRGYRTEFWKTVPMVPYVKLTNNPVVQRTSPTSNQALLKFSGACDPGSFGKERNTLRLRYRLCPEGGEFTPWQEVAGTPGYDCTYEQEVLLTDLDYTKTYTLETVAVDALEEAACTLTVLPGVPAFHWKKDGFFFHVPVAFDESLNGAYIRKHTLSGEDRLAFVPETGQSIFICGADGAVCGILGSAGTWWGSPNVTAQCLDGQVQISLPQGCSGEILLMSTAPICIE